MRLVYEHSTEIESRPLGIVLSSFFSVISLNKTVLLRDRKRRTPCTPPGHVRKCKKNATKMQKIVVKNEKNEKKKIQNFSNLFLKFFFIIFQKIFQNFVWAGGVGYLVNVTSGTPLPPPPPEVAPEVTPKKKILGTPHLKWHQK